MTPERADQDRRGGEPALVDAGYQRVFEVIAGGAEDDDKEKDKASKK